MRLSVLVASHARRAPLLARLVGLLAPQMQNGVEVVVLWNRGAKTIGDYRQALLEDARGEYVCFVDDDDRIPDYYVSEILQALGEDYVGFEVAVEDLSPNPLNKRYRSYRALHSLKYPKWTQKSNVFYRHVSHLNPIRKELALKATFAGSRAEDVNWALQVRPHVRTENYVDRVMYFYDFNHPSSLRGGKPDRTVVSRPVLPDGFRYHPDSED